MLTLVACTYALDFGHAFGDNGSGARTRLSAYTIAHHTLGLVGCAWAVASRRLGAVLCRLLLDSCTSVIVCAEEVCASALNVHAPRFFNRAYVAAFVAVRLVYYPLVLASALIATAPAPLWTWVSSTFGLDRTLEHILGRRGNRENDTLFCMLAVWFLFSTVAHTAKFRRAGGFAQWNHV